MLKIKDNVDLKALEKFGFEKLDNDIRGHKYSWKRYFDSTQYYEIYIAKDNRISIYIFCNWGYQIRINSKLQIKLYDLIKANLVEKVEE